MAVDTADMVDTAAVADTAEVADMAVAKTIRASSLIGLVPTRKK
jgi:hypothetical protein